MSNMSKACEFDKRTIRKIRERDSGCCILCGKPWKLQTAHYIGRAHGGLGIEQNGVTLCIDCHQAFDNGDKRKEFGALIRDYLKSNYSNWNEKDLVYDKYRWVIK